MFINFFFLNYFAFYAPRNTVINNPVICHLMLFTENGLTRVDSRVRNYFSAVSDVSEEPQ
jgi:hypothetical protein